MEPIQINTSMEDFEEYLDRLYANIVCETEKILRAPEQISLMALPPKDRVEALHLFAATRDAQLAGPELMIGHGNKPLFHGHGIFTYYAEHLGDLLNRMVQPHCERISFGFEFVAQKVARAHRDVHNEYGFMRDVEEALVTNYNHSDKSMTLDEWKADFRAAAKRYADAHASLPVYNPLQKLARQAAIDLGNLDERRLIATIDALHAWTQDREKFEHHASLVNVNAKGEIIPLRS